MLRMPKSPAFPNSLYVYCTVNFAEVRYIIFRRAAVVIYNRTLTPRKRLECRWWPGTESVSATHWTPNSGCWNHARPPGHCCLIAVSYRIEVALSLLFFMSGTNTAMGTSPGMREIYVLLSN
jgi:hypothetical protein